MPYSRRSFMKIGGLSVVAFGTAGRVMARWPQEAEDALRKMVEGVEPVNPADREARLDQARRLMAEHGFDGLFLTGSTDLVYFTGVSWRRSERTFGAVLNRKGEPVWICPAFELERAQESIPPGHAVRTWEEHESPFRLLADILKDLGAQRGRLALGPTVRSFVLHGLRRDAPGLEVLDGAAVCQGCRAVKTAKELGYMDLANRITKMAYQEGFKTLQEGLTAGGLSDAIQRAHRQVGVSGGGRPQFGPQSAFPHGSSVRRNLREGDVVLVDGGCSVEGFRSDVTRTIVFGKPSDRQRKVWDAVRKAQIAALGAVRPGVACEEIDRAARKVIEDAGFGPGYRYFTHRVGHGIGMDGHEYPYLVQGNTRKLAPGMTFSNEPGIYLYGEFGVRIEDCFAVTEDGGRHLGGMESASIEAPFG